MTIAKGVFYNAIRQQHQRPFEIYLFTIIGTELKFFSWFYGTIYRLLLSFIPAITTQYKPSLCTNIAGVIIVNDAIIVDMVVGYFFAEKPSPAISATGPYSRGRYLLWTFRRFHLIRTTNKESK